MDSMVAAHFFTVVAGGIRAGAKDKVRGRIRHG